MNGSNFPTLPGRMLYMYTHRLKKTCLLASDLGYKLDTSLHFCNFYTIHIPGRVAQSVTCLARGLATDASLTADPGVASSIPARSHTFVEIDHEIISTVILLPSAESFQKGFCQLQAKVCARSTG